MDEEGRLKELTRRPKARAEARRPKPLGDILTLYMGDCLEPRHEAFAKVAEAWQEIVPRHLARFCRLADVSRGTVRVRVNSPAYMHQLRLQAGELLAHLQLRAGRKTVRNIRFEIGW
ncbi:MAG TPA: DUF721 domain-containing protein [Sedimentisphaerales bacterium]|nr:DUF721 domain-containing protein [Sedimentisphaerales bacterium]